MKPDWRQRSISVHKRFLRLANAKGQLRSNAELLNFFALAIAGEAGELANLIKKRWRGDKVAKSDICDEIADIRIYLEHISRHLKFDLDEACERKLNEVSNRLDVKERSALNEGQVE